MLFPAELLIDSTGGANYVVDAACASRWQAPRSKQFRPARSRDREDGSAGGADAMQCSIAYIAFSKTHILSLEGPPRPLMKRRWTVLSEAVGVRLLKQTGRRRARTATAFTRSIKGIGSSSDSSQREHDLREP